MNSSVLPKSTAYKPDVEVIYRWSSTLEETFASVMQSEIHIVSIPPQEIELALNLLPIQGAEIQFLLEYIDQLEQDHTNNNPTNSTVALSAPGPSPSSQVPSSAAPSTHSLTVPTIRPEHQSYVCSWHQHGSDALCSHVAPDRSAFLRHLGELHQVSGASDGTIICQLLDSKMGSTCKTPIMRGNFPRHVDTHYRIRYQCQYCPAGKSFSRQDSWKKHIRTKHAQTP